MEGFQFYIGILLLVYVSGRKLEDADAQSSCFPPCQNGYCSGGRCQCYPGWTGPQCQYNVAGSCNPSCVNGYCSGGLCICNPGWNGAICDVVAICNPPCVRGICVAANLYENKCRCNPGWGGPTCTTAVNTGGGGDCFPPNAYVRNEKGLKVLMKDLQIGEKVLTMGKDGNHLFTETIMMLHQNENATSNYIQISTKDDVTLTLSSHHLIPLSNSSFIFGKDVQVNQNITSYDSINGHFKKSQVTEIQHISKTGLYAPLTMEGTIMVNDVLVSCYASFPSHAISHGAFSLWRTLYQWTSPSLLSWSNSDDGVHWYPAALKGAATYVGLLAV